VGKVADIMLPVQEVCPAMRPEVDCEHLSSSGKAAERGRQVTLSVGFKGRREMVCTRSGQQCALVPRVRTGVRGVL